jgi:hypothetical protein
MLTIVKIIYLIEFSHKLSGIGFRMLEDRSQKREESPNLRFKPTNKKLFEEKKLTKKLDFHRMKEVVKRTSDFLHFQYTH